MMTAEARAKRFARRSPSLVLLCACRREESPSETIAGAGAALRPPDRGAPDRLRLACRPRATRPRTPACSIQPASSWPAPRAPSSSRSSTISSPRARHESGAAYLLIDRDRDAIDALESAVRQSPNNAAYWSDLAAARYTLAVTEKRPHELPQALADADHALRLHPALPDALFNRALIIESLGISEAARRAWQRYAAADPSTHWSAEAMHHLGNLPVVTTRDEFQHHLAAATRAFRPATTRHSSPSPEITHKKPEPGAKARSSPNGPTPSAKATQRRRPKH